MTPNGPREYRVKFTDGDEAEYTDSTIGVEAAQAMLGKRQGVIQYNDHAGWFDVPDGALEAPSASTPAADATPAAPVAPTEG